MSITNWVAPSRAQRVARLGGHLKQNVTITPVVSRDMYGKVTLGAPGTYPAYVEGRVQMVRTAAGDERASSVTVILAGMVQVGPDDRLTLPDGTSPPILAVGTVPDGDGYASTVVYT